MVPPYPLLCKVEGEDNAENKLVKWSAQYGRLYSYKCYLIYTKYVCVCINIG